MNNNEDIKWSSKLKKVTNLPDAKFKSPDDDLTEKTTAATVESIGTGTAATVENIETDLDNIAIVSKINNCIVLDVNNTKDNLLLKINELEDIDNLLNEIDSSDKDKINFQELKSSVYAKKSILETYIKVIDNICKNTLPVITNYPDNRKLAETIKNSVSGIIDGIKNEALQTQTLIEEIKKLDLIEKKESIHDED